MTKHLYVLDLNFIYACIIKQVWMWLSVEMVRSFTKPLFAGKVILRLLSFLNILPSIYFALNCEP
mgnify:CR=1 FL=1